MSKPLDYEECAALRQDHDYDPRESASLHNNCSLRMRRVEVIGIGNGPDHNCEDHPIEK